MHNELDSYEEEAIEDNSIKGSFAKLNKGQKIASAVLAFFAVVVFLAWGFNLRHSIMAPLDRSAGNVAHSQKNSSGQALCTGDNCAGSELEEELKQQDTDGDGLSDWDELNVYKTSPYIADSDSDGFSDGQEVESGNDPNCPMGAVCGGTEKDYGENGDALDMDSNLLPGINNSINSGGTDPNIEADNEALEKMLSGQIDASGMRSLMLQAGMDGNILNQISDEDLMQYYNETLDSFNSGLNEDQ